MMDNWIIASIVAIVFTIIVHFAIVVRIRKMQNSVAESTQTLIGRHAEVTITIPSDGMGEVYFRGGSISNKPAVSYDGVEVPVGSKVVVLGIKDGFICQVSKLPNIDEEEQLDD